LLSLKELQQNYRSSRAVVQFSNVVHLWRKLFFGLKSLEPQRPWWTDQLGIPPQKGILYDNLVMSESQDLAKGDLIFVLPCDEGGEVDFLKNSVELKSIFPQVAKNKRPFNVYSAIAVKGMQFSQVILCGFGEYFAQEFGTQTLGAFPLGKLDLKLEYFLNKLYVAATRAEKVLGIIDTQQGDRCLWQASNETHLSNWIQKLPLQKQQDWRSQTKALSRSFSKKTFEQGNPLEIAQVFLRDGLEQHNLDFLETAAYFYDRAQQAYHAEYCRAWMLRLHGELLQAGQCFMRLPAFHDPALNPQQEAWDCFWQGQQWHALLEWCDTYPHAAKCRWRSMIEFMVNAKSKEMGDRTLALTKMTDFVSSEWKQIQPIVEHSRDFTWEQIFEQVRSSIEQALEQPSEHPYRSAPLLPSLAAGTLITQRHLWPQMLTNIAAAGFSPKQSLTLAAHCAYQIGDYQTAISRWEQCQDIHHALYWQARAELAPIPEKIDWYSLAHQTEPIIALWQQERQFTSAWVSVVGDLCHALEQAELHLELLELEMQQGQWLLAVQRVKARMAAQDPAFDETLRLSMLNRMIADESLTAETLARSTEQRLTGNNQPSASLKQVHREARLTICEFITATTQLEGWISDFTHLLDVSRLFDRIYEFNPALDFYQRFRNGQDSEMGEFARAKWIETKQHQADYAEQMGRPNQADRHREKAKEMTENWWLVPPSGVLTTGDLPSNLPSGDLPSGDLPSGDWMEGFPSTQDTLRQRVGDRIDTLSNAELQLINTYISFLEFQRPGANHD
jgi:tetratricopeptide (TPR) repeat protein